VAKFRNLTLKYDLFDHEDTSDLLKVTISIIEIVVLKTPYIKPKTVFSRSHLDSKTGKNWQNSAI